MVQIHESNVYCLLCFGFFHGSKGESGNDEEIVYHSTTPLEILLTKVLAMTKGLFKTLLKA